MSTLKKSAHKSILYFIVVVMLTVATLLIYINLFTRYREKCAITKPRIQAQKLKSYSILIDTEEKKLYLLCNGRLIKKFNCAVGKNETPSPLGSYRVTNKSHWGEGFGGYWLGINCPWGNYGIHGTTRPDTIGTKASHGCFRMYNSDIEYLYKTVSCGVPVCITGGIFGAFGDRYREIVPYMFGRDVQVVQIRLKEAGYYTGCCNGRYDDNLKIVLHKFQIAHGLAVSDKINKKTLTALGFILME